MPSPDESRVAHAAFERIETGDIFYRIGLDLVHSVLAGRSDITLAQAVGLLLPTWNQAFYRYHPFDEHHLAELAALLESFPERVIGYKPGH